jgi:putative ABC transport system permease protein
MTWQWVAGVARRRTGRMAMTALGVALTVAMLTSLVVFFAASMRTMTDRAINSVAVDWQVQVNKTATPAQVQKALAADPGTQAALQVGFARVPHLQATTGKTTQTTQTTGTAQVLGIPPDYTSTFPGEVRLLTGTSNGVLLAQQTAANLHASPGSTVKISRPGLSPIEVTVAGVVELPQADSLFQHVGAPPGSQPAAPPDNVVLLPSESWAKAFNPVASAHPGAVTTQFHVQRSQVLPAEPPAAYVDETNAARHLEAASAGAAVVGDNLGAALDAARQDAAYSRVLFLFLGVPGAALAAALCAAIAAAGGPLRRREFSLLRARGAARRQLLTLASAEAVLLGAVGCVVGIAAASVVGRWAFGTFSFGATSATALISVALVCMVGLATAVLSVVVPARRDIDAVSVAEGRRSIARAGRRVWMRLGLDLVALAGALVIFWITSQKGYTLVLVPEGVPTISVSYWAFLGPTLLWVAVSLLTWRLATGALARDGRWIATPFRGLFGNLGSVVSSALSRQSQTVVRSTVLVALALTFAVSTSTFNATYRQQAEVDAQLTNGADVTVTESPGSHVQPSAGSQIAATPGVNAVEPMQHRYAYVGVDLQDLYGINANTISRATTLQDPYFQGGTASEILGRLANTPDGILVSAETVNDFQLHLGDMIKLRLQNSGTQQYQPVRFHYVGIANEFPTAPKDSFLVANAAYIAQQTGDSSVGAFLVDTSSTNVDSVANALKTKLANTATVTTITHTRGVVGSSLTSVDLSGLTRLELAFAFVIVAIAGGLVPALTFTERRKTLAVASSLRASPRQLRAFGLGEVAFVAVGGVIAGAVAGWGLSQMLVKVLTGVFDPPPSSLAYPLLYLGFIAVAACAALGVAAVLTTAHARRAAAEHLREL